MARKSYAVGARPRSLPHGDKRIFKGKNEKDIVDAEILSARQREWEVVRKNKKRCAMKKEWTKQGRPDSVVLVFLGENAYVW